MFSKNYFKFLVSDMTIRVLEFDQYECRGDNALEILATLVGMDPGLFEGRTGIMSFWDHPLDPRHADDYDLAFCSTKRRGETSAYVEMPCPYSLSWPQVGISDGEALTRELLDYSRQPDSEKIFWIGAETHPSRRRLHQLSLRVPESIEAQLMSWKRNDGSIQLEARGKYATLQDHARYKYLIDCPGAGYSGRIRWLLATGRPLFIVDRPLIEHWHDEMVPWVHYIPVKEDLSDLMDSYERIENDPDLYGAISRNAKNFVKSNLLFERQLERMMRATIEAQSRRESA